jgi:hypothetical protein
VEATLAGDQADPHAAEALRAVIDAALGLAP